MPRRAPTPTPPRHRLLVALLLTATLLALAGCAGDDGSSAGSAGSTTSVESTTSAPSTTAASTGPGAEWTCPSGSVLCEPGGRYRFDVAVATAEVRAAGAAACGPGLPSGRGVLRVEVQIVPIAPERPPFLVLPRVVLVGPGLDVDGRTVAADALRFANDDDCEEAPTAQLAIGETETLVYGLRAGDPTLPVDGPLDAYTLVLCSPTDPNVASAFLNGWGLATAAPVPEPPADACSLTE